MKIYYLALSLLSLFRTTQSSQCVCTTVPCPVEGWNNLTIHSAEDKPDNTMAWYKYELHNSIPVVVKANVTAHVDTIGAGSGTTSCTRSYAQGMDDDGIVDCDAGHIFAHHLGGPGNQPLNIFPQNGPMNKGTYNQFETKIYNCLMETNGPYFLSWNFYYNDTTRTKPDFVDYAYEYNGNDKVSDDCQYATEYFDNRN